MARAFRIKPSTVHERFGDETVILNLDVGTYYSVQGVGTVIWGLLGQGASDDIIRASLAEQFGAAEGIAAGVATFLEKLVAEGLVEPAAETAAANIVAMKLEQPLAAFFEPTLQKYTDMEEMLLLDPIHEVDEHGWPKTREQMQA